jgi:hypothetical protein
VKPSGYHGAAKSASRLEPRLTTVIGACGGIRHPRTIGKGGKEIGQLLRHLSIEACSERPCARRSGRRRAEGSLLAGDAVHQRVPVACLGSIRFEPGLEGGDRLGKDLVEILHAVEIANDLLDF